MRVLVTGGDGFIGQNLVMYLSEMAGIETEVFIRSGTLDLLKSKVEKSDLIFHLAGENRPENDADYDLVNRGLTESLCDLVEATQRNIPIVFASSTQALIENAYGISKKAAEDYLHAYANRTGNGVLVFRLPNVFGKWSRPNYNSVVATFCFNIANERPIVVNDSSAKLTLVYIDDVVSTFVECIAERFSRFEFRSVDTKYITSLGELAQQIRSFGDCRSSLVIDGVGLGFVRALYSTYVSFLPKEKFTYPLVAHADDRGVFVEMLKTRDSGQFSFFTAGPGISRGGHYHHTKTEKFLVIRGNARFGFRHMVSGERHVVDVEGNVPQIVETVPGWTHDVTNIGSEDLLVMLWANEIFDPEAPDTYTCKV